MSELILEKYFNILKEKLSVNTVKPRDVNQFSGLKGK